MENKNFKLPNLSFLKKLKPQISAEKKKDMIKISILFASVLFSAALILACLSNFIAPLAKSRAEAEAMDAMKGLFPAEKYEDVAMSFDAALGINSAKKAFRGKELLGYCIETTTKGYEGEIHMVVGIDYTGVVRGVEILSIKETPGYGDRVSAKEFLDRFKGKKSELAVVRKTTDKENEITAISGATVSSNAVKEGVNHAIAAVTQIRAAENIKAAEAAAAKKEESSNEDKVQTADDPSAEPRAVTEEEIE